jgi:hypothetical protein
MMRSFLEYLVVTVALAAASASWLIWTLAAPETQDNSFHADGQRIMLAVTVGGTQCHNLFRASLVRK